MRLSEPPLQLASTIAFSDDPLRIAVVAPPWIPVPPPAYGGIEAVVDLVCEALVARGHEVTLFAAPGSSSLARVVTPLEAAHPDEIGASLYESDHIASIWARLDRAAERGRPFDVIHDHSGFTALAMADRISTPVVHTLHGPFVAATERFYQRHGAKATLVAISRSQAESAPLGVTVADIVPNPIAVDRWPLHREKSDYVLWAGRMDPVKGAHHAIEAARLANRRLVLAGPIQTGQEAYFRTRIAPHVDDRLVHYVGDIGGAAKRELFADAAALLMPIRWREPFGMVMVEALACGTPVIAFAEGAAKEIVIDGENGVLVRDESEMARAIGEIGSIDPDRCRASVAERYGMSTVGAGYERVYRAAIGSGDRRARAGGPRRALAGAALAVASTGERR